MAVSHLPLGSGRGSFCSISRRGFGGRNPESELEARAGLEDIWKWQWRKKKNIPEHYVHKPCSLDLALSPPDTGLGALSTGWCGAGARAVALTGIMTPRSPLAPLKPFSPGRP